MRQYIHDKTKDFENTTIVMKCDKDDKIFSFYTYLRTDWYRNRTDILLGSLSHTKAMCERDAKIIF